MSCSLTLCFVLPAVDGKIEQHVCIKFFVKLGKFAGGFWRTFFEPDSGF
jgi:hypothetical protein